MNVFVVSVAGRGGVNAKRAGGDGLSPAAANRLPATTTGRQGTAAQVPETTRGETPAGCR